MAKVSIIIPFNNVESYIEECLNSVVNQTLTDIEIILINDASTDSSRSIAENFSQKDSRIKIIDISERKGQGYARNRGIEIATGDYIGFVDSDDFIEKDMFEILYSNASLNNTDIEMCMVEEYDDINKNYKTSEYYSLAVLSKFGDSIFSAEDTKENILDINVALWNKIYKREYLNSIGERFPEGFIYEDLPFFFGTYLPAKKIQIVWKNLYYYRVNRKNSTMQQYNNKILDRLPMVSLTYDKLKNTAYLNDMKKQIQGWIINDLFHRYVLLKENYHKEFFFLMKKVFENLEIENVNDRYWRSVYHFEGYLLVLNNTFEDFTQKVFYKYLDLHKIENRLRSELTNSKEIDKRFGLIYSDLDKNYKYTEELIAKSDKTNEDKIRDLWEKINNISSEVEKFISSKNINNEENCGCEEEYVNNKISECIKISENQISGIKEDLVSQFEEKYKSLYNDFKDLSFVVQNNFVELNKEQYNVRNFNENLKKEVNEIQNEIKNELISISDNYKVYVNNQTSEINRNVENLRIALQKNENRAEEEIRQYEEKSAETLQTIKNEFLKMMQEQENRHKEEIEVLESKINILETSLRKELKPPCVKILHKCLNKSEK